MATVKAKKTKKVEGLDEMLMQHEDVLTEDGEKAVLVTKEGLEKLKEEYEHLTTVKKKEVANRLKEAISYGDLSENSEYEEAKNEQAFVEGRILEVERMIKNAKVISGKAGTKDSIQLGTTVHLKNLSKDGAAEVYTIVGSTEANPFEGKISNESPVGSALLDKEKGDKVEVIVPAGVVKYEIVKLG